MSEVGYEAVRTQESPVGGSKKVQRIYDPLKFPAMTGICWQHTRDQLTRPRGNQLTQAHTRSINARRHARADLIVALDLSRSVAQRIYPVSDRAEHRLVSFVTAVIYTPWYAEKRENFLSLFNLSLPLG